MTALRHQLLALLASVTPLIAVAQRPAATVPVWTGKPDLVLGKEDDEHETFSFVSGMAVLRDGRLVVADWKDHRVRVFSPSGQYQFDIGREGGGPGEFRQPCCMRVLDDGTLLVGDPQASRFNLYRVEASRAVSIGTIVTRGAARLDPLAPALSRLAVNRFAMLSSNDAGDCRREHEVQHMDSTGKPLTNVKIATPPEDSLDIYVSRMQFRGGRGCAYHNVAYGSRFLLALAPNGGFARAVSGRYDIEWRSADGKVRARLSKDPEPPAPLTSNERARQSQTIDDVRNAYKGPRRVVVPDGRPPIAALKFDELNRLWVVRSTPATSLRVADVYDASGRLLARATWPAELPLEGSSVVMSTALYIATTDTSDVRHITRIRFR